MNRQPTWCVRCPATLVGRCTKLSWRTCATTCSSAACLPPLRSSWRPAVFQRRGACRTGGQRLHGSVDPGGGATVPSARRAARPSYSRPKPAPPCRNGRACSARRPVYHGSAAPIAAAERRLRSLPAGIGPPANASASPGGLRVFQGDTHRFLRRELHGLPLQHRTGSPVSYTHLTL